MRILHLEDNAADAELVREFLREEWPDCVTEVVAARPHFLHALEQGDHDVILSDFSFVSFSGLEGLQLAHEHAPQTPFIFFSGTIREQTAIEAVRDGAADYVLKDRPMRLITAIRHALLKRQETEKRGIAERRIREQNELLDKARDAIIVSDLENRVLSWNQGATRLLGWPSAETVGERLERFFGPNALATLTAAGGTAVDEWRGEIAACDKAGQALALDTHVTLIRDDAGRPTARVSISTDITEKNRLKEQFFRAQRLESLGKLAAGIAHDLNNVLAPILMAPAMLRERVRDPADVQMLDMLEKSAQRGTDLVRQILGFAQGSTGQRQLLQVKRLLRDLTGFIQQTFPKEIVLEQSIPGDLWPILASATQIHQVLLNLCINARDAMPEGGKLRIRAENVTLDAKAAQRIDGAHPGNWLVLHIEDTGTGIPPEVLGRIWEPFFTTKAPEKGTGLGLSTVRGIVENHGGFITVASEPGRGTVFHVYLPVEGVAHGVEDATLH